ncbi:sulfatase-like hydrolase/transferase [Botrimarina hoheduenensis]|uniref:Arylsulfatase n=1 Tax=Botrimarina hoheduenensis TaxID=2528000 RepID=A0A5C5VQ27_9BACT|nr:sulfatase-like hydrolase/transferase [Botrimarina hoheduenensis]TWT40684.1 Arylsulfatase [Botrimarina hoheduenensis]
MIDRIRCGRHRRATLALTLALACSGLVGFAAQPTRPNVVLILIDDLSHYGVTAYGSNRVSEETGLFKEQFVSTPRIDRLAAEGLRCTYAHVYPLCEPTRVAILTGQYNSRNFVQPKALHASQITISDLFKRAGYATGIFGKWKQSRGTASIPGKDYLYEFGWDEFCCFDVVDQGSRYLNPNLVINGEVIDFGKKGSIDPDTGRRWYGPDICNRQLLDFVRRHRDEPFFVYYPMLLVHDEHTPTPDTHPSSAFDRFSDKPCYQKPCPGDDRSYFPDMLAYTDKLIGRVVDELERLGVRDNTLILVMGDNGTKEPFSHHLADGTVYPGGKGDTKDNGTHVPLILAPGKSLGTKIEAGEGVYKGLVDVVDILPTLCEAAEVPIAEQLSIDGVSFWPQVKGRGGEHRDHIYAWYNANTPWTETQHLLRYAFDRSFKRYAENQRFREGRFFDLRTDLLELAGNREERVAWGHRRRSGLDPALLNKDQRSAYARLGAVLDANTLVPVETVRIEASIASVKVGETRPLRAEVSPANAIRRNLIWESSDPAVASVNKFGDLTAHASGEVTVTAYAWDAAAPVATGGGSEYSRAGPQDTVRVRVAAGVN